MTETKDNSFFIMFKTPIISTSFVVFENTLEEAYDSFLNDSRFKVFESRIRPYICFEENNLVKCKLCSVTCDATSNYLYFHEHPNYRCPENEYKDYVRSCLSVIKV